jgi:hypothetical protein
MVCVFCGQDYEAFRKGDDIEAATIWGNCTLKFCMKLECNVTFQKFNESAGEKYVMVQESYETKDTMFGRKHIPAESSRVEKRPVLSLKDLKDQKDGEETLIYGSRVHRLNAFYADPIMAPKARLNHFLEIRSPSHSQVVEMREGVDSVYRKFRQRLDEDWEKHESTVRSILLSFIPFPQDFLKTYSQMDSHIEENPGAEMPNETELAIFAFSVYSKKIDLIDHNINNTLKASMGIETEEYDDELLLEESSGNMRSFAPDFDESPVIESNIADVLVKPTKRVDKEVVKKSHIDDLGVDLAVFEKIEGIVRRKEARLRGAEDASFDSLDAINLSAFDTQRGIQSLEEVLLKKEGKSSKEAARLSDLTAKNMVIEMGLKTNVAIVSEPEKKRKSPSRSKREVDNLIDQFTKTVS